MKKHIILIFISLLVPVIASADDENLFQDYYDTSSEVITNLKKCSSIQDQFSNEVTQCYLQNAKNIQAKTNDFYQKNKAFFESAYKQNGDVKLDITNKVKLNALKKSCVSTYPAPLVPHFKNQILECQVEIDLQRYFFFYTYILNS